MKNSQLINGRLHVLWLMEKAEKLHIKKELKLLNTALKIKATIQKLSISTRCLINKFTIGVKDTNMAK